MGIPVATNTVRMANFMAENRVKHSFLVSLSVFCLLLRRIAVTGDVFLTELETRIIDTPDFQRLRGVRQLGS